MLSAVLAMPFFSSVTVLEWYDDKYVANPKGLVRNWSRPSRGN
jgi:hypothetical protein